MKFCRNVKIFIGLSILLIPSLANAQWYNRLEVGYSYVTASGVYQGTEGVYDKNLNYLGDSSVKRNIKATEGVGYDIGLSIPVKQVGRRNMWSISCHVIYNGFIWDGLNEGIGANGFFNLGSVPDLYGATIQIGAPVALEYKFGPDAVCSKKYHLGFSLGAGVIPAYNFTVLLGFSDGNGLGGAGLGYSANPFVKTEIALFGGLCFKLRAQVSFANTPYINANKNDVTLTTGPMTLTGTTETMLSFIIMPFSWHWKEKDWYNTYGKYNKWQ